MAITGTVTSSQGVLTLGSTPNDTITFTPSSGSYTVEYPIGTVAINASSSTQVLSLANGGQMRILCVSGSVAYSLTANADDYALTPAQLAATQALVSGAGVMPSTGTVRIGTWGDSRANNASSANNHYNSQAPVAQRQATYLAAVGGNCKLVFNGGLGGDVASNWADSARAGTKTLAALGAANIDVLLFQIGINDIIAGTATATITANVLRSISALSTMVKKLYVESIYPCTATGYGATPATKEAARVAINAAVAAGVASMPNVRFINTDPLMLDTSTGYGNAAYLLAADGIHSNAAQARAVIDQYMLPAYRVDFPFAIAPMLTGLIGPNVADSLFQSQTAGKSNDLDVQTNSGTVTSGSYSIGTDEYGIYQEFVATPTALASGYASVIARFHARVAGGSPLFTVAQNDVMVGGMRVRISAVGGGAPNIAGFALRLRDRYSTASLKTGGFSAINDGISAGELGATYTADCYAPWIITPQLTLGGASVDMDVPADPVTAGTSARGLCFELLAYSQVINVPFRVRMYAPAIGKIA